MTTGLASLIKLNQLVVIIVVTVPTEWKQSYGTKPVRAEVTYI